MKFMTYHYRRIRGELRSQKEIRELGLSPLVEPRGGKTVVEIYDNEGMLTVGFAYCSDQDNYNKKIGRLIAEGRALKQVGLHA